MATLQYVGIDTSLYTSQTAVPPDSLDSDDNRSPEDRLSNDCDNDESIVQLDDGVDVTPNDSQPLLFFMIVKQPEEVIIRIILLKWQLLW